MKRLGGIWEPLTSFENLLLAYKKARRGKMNRVEVGKFTYALENELLRLQHRLRNQSYRPGEFRQFEIYDRKPRLISAAPFRDRVVHHAIMNLIEPYIDRRLYEHSYACRKDKGVHKAVRQYQQWSHRYRYVLNVDILKYFPTIDHEILKSKIARLIKDRDTLWLIGQIIDQSPHYDVPQVLFPGDDLISIMQRKRGLPIGNLTSQIFANLYLTAFDFYLKQECKVPAYLRYVDDCALLADSKAELWEYHDAMQEFLQRERLLLHPGKTRLQPTSLPLTLLGYRVSPGSVRLGNNNGYRYRRLLKQLARAYQQERITLKEVSQSIAAWKGHAQHADSWQLRKKLFSSITFSKGVGWGEERTPTDARVARDCWGSCVTPTYRGSRRVGVACGTDHNEPRLWSVTTDPSKAGKGNASIPSSSCVARRRLEQQTRQRSFREPQQEQSR